MSSPSDAKVLISYSGSRIRRGGRSSFVISSEQRPFARAYCQPSSMVGCSTTTPLPRQDRANFKGDLLLDPKRRSTENFPHHRAVPFQPSDLRGFFHVVTALSPPKPPPPSPDPTPILP